MERIFLHDRYSFFCGLADDSDLHTMRFEIWFFYGYAWRSGRS